MSSSPLPIGEGPGVGMSGMHRGVDDRPTPYPSPQGRGVQEGEGLKRASYLSKLRAPQKSGLNFLRSGSGRQGKRRLMHSLK